MHSDEDEKQDNGAHYDVELSVDVENHLKDQINALKESGAPESVDRYMPNDDRRGPWDDEPDHFKWITEEGYEANVLRGGIWRGLCGYVTLPVLHGMSQLGWDREVIYSLSVHGGVTFSDACAVNSDGEFEASDEFWTVGFDASHFMDLTPRLPVAMYDSIVAMGGEYRDFDYMVEQTNGLSRQLFEQQHHKDGDVTEH